MDTADQQPPSATLTRQHGGTYGAHLLDQRYAEPVLIVIGDLRSHTRAWPDSARRTHGAPTEWNLRREPLV